MNTQPDRRHWRRWNRANQ